MIGPEVHQLTAERTSVVTEEPPRRASMDCEPIQHRDDVLAAKALAHLDGHTFSRIHIDDGEGAKSATIYQLIGYKVQRPSVIWPRHRWPVGSDDHGFPPPWWLMTERQTFFAVEAVHEVLSHGPAFPVEQHANLPVAIPNPCLGHLSEPLSECGAGIAMTSIVVGGPRAADNPARAPLTDRVGPP